MRIACVGTGIANTPDDHDAVMRYIKPQISGGAAPSGTVVDLVVGCFLSSDNTTSSTVVMNPNDSIVQSFTLSFNPTSGSGGGSISNSLPAHSITTYTYDAN